MSQALIDIQKEIAKELAEQSKGFEAPSGRYIGTKGRMFTLPDGTQNPGPMQAVVLDYRNTRSFYEGAYNPSKPQAPVCYASAKTIEELVPVESSPKKAHATCTGCPNNEWGSAPGGGNGKACKSGVTLALVSPDATADASPMLLRVSPTALKFWAEIGAKLEAAKKILPQVVLEIGFATDSAYPQLTFKILGENENLETHWGLRATATAALDRVPDMG